MAQTGYTPILIYSSSTAAQAPAAGNLTNSTLGSELAINITDGKLFYKDNANAVQVIAWKVTPTTAGGTGLTSYTAGDLLYYATGTTLAKLAIGASTNILTSSGSAPQWTAPSSITVGKATNLDGGAAGSVPYQSGAGATTFLGIGAANTVLTSSGSAPQWSTALSLAGNLTAANIGVTDTNWIGWGNFASRFTGTGGGPVNVVTNSVTAGTWDTSQNYTFYGNLIQGTAAKGVNFTANTPAAGMTSQLLNWYEEITAASTACTGAITTAVSWKLTRVGNVITLTLPPVTGAATSSAFFEFGVLVPSGYRPASSLLFPCGVRDNDANQSTVGMCIVTSSGNIRIYPNIAASANFTANVSATAAGFAQGCGFSCSWRL